MVDVDCGLYYPLGVMLDLLWEPTSQMTPSNIRQASRVHAEGDAKCLSIA